MYHLIICFPKAFDCISSHSFITERWAEKFQASSTSTSVHRESNSVACLTSVGSVQLTHFRNLVSARLSLVR